MHALSTTAATNAATNEIQPEPVADRSARGRARVQADGKHLRRGQQPFRVKGATYGTFLARADGALYPERDAVARDFAAMAAAGLNTVRTYTLPPADVLDLADEHGLHVLVGLHYDDWRAAGEASRTTRRRILDAGRRSVHEALARCDGRAGVLAVSVGNEVPADLVRLHGATAVEDVLGTLVSELHAGDPSLLATYVNFPTTEFLDVPGADLVCFNVFLERPEALRAYLRHLQVVSGTRPLLVTELGLASGAYGEDAQAESLAWQLRTVDECGVAGASVFAWTDEWGVAGHPVEGWGFGVTRVDRSPKPALDVVRDWANAEMVDLREEWPRVSVVVCAYNEQRTIEECLRSLEQCRYPNLEVIVCDDGSTDATREIAARFPFRLLELPHGGLSRGRNAGMDAATGDIIAYLDADAACHPDWPFHLALSFDDENVAATGGPNLPFEHVGLAERAVALSPGGPAEVLLADDRAEHVPGCNMAYRAEELRVIGGFDPVYTSAGDDVDVCWKLLEKGREIAFAPAAQVRHHRRAKVRAYLRQQRGYGRAERMLQRAHPHRFNRLGQARWAGFIYGGARILPSVLRPVVYHGYAGSAPFQPVARRRAELANMWTSALLPMALPLAAALSALALLSPWTALAGAAVLALVVGYGAAVAVALPRPRGEPQPLRLRLLVGALHVLQPFARVRGRLSRPAKVAMPLPSEASWTGDRWAWIHALERSLVAARCHVRFGTPTAGWDLQAVRGPFFAARLSTAVVWTWTPVHRVRWRVRRSVLAVAAVVVALAALRPWLGGIAAALAVAGATAEALGLRGAVRTALRSTTAGA